jgi:hypothetical protein
MSDFPKSYVEHTNLKVNKMHGSEADKGIEYYKSLIPADAVENTRKRQAQENLVQIELPNC